MADNAQSDGPARGASIVNLGLAALAAGSLGFLVFAMPEQTFSDLIAGSGLPAYLPAAEPPLGMKARAGVIAAVALLVFAFVLLVLRGVDRLSSRPARAAAAPQPAEPDAEAPRLRRADTHPDAPARRPLLAGRDLGFGDADEYDYPPDADDDEMFADLPAQPLPGFLTAGRDGPGALEEQESAQAPLEESFEAAEPRKPELEQAVYEEAGFEEEQAEEEPLILDVPADEPSVEALVSQLPEAEESSDNSITSLMRRLETGLVRREETVDGSESQPADMEEQPSAPPSWLAPQPVGEDLEAVPVEAHEGQESKAHVPEEQPSAPPSWLASEPVAEQPEEAEQAEAFHDVREEAEQAEAPAPPIATAASFPPVDEFGEPSWPAPRTEETQFAALGGQHRPSAAKVQALPSAPAPAPSIPAEAEAPSEMSIGRRLRSAIADMDRIASSGG
jgi:hypothetical protein